MKNNTLTAAIAFTSLLTLGGTSFAAEGPHDAYNRAFYGTSSSQSSDTMGKAAYGTPSGGSPWSGHEAYSRAILGVSGTPQTDTMGKAAFGTGSSGIDGNAIYRSAFRGD